MLFFLSPQEQISKNELHAGLRNLTFDGICSQIMGSLTGGAFLVAFALLLGASNFVIGLIAALGQLSQLLQIPSVYLIEIIRRRKRLVVFASFFSRMFWFGIAVIPWLVPEPLRVPMLLGSLFIYFGLGTISGLAYGSWMRDFIPETILGRYMGKRMAIATAVGAGLSLIAGGAVDLYKQQFTELGIYSFYFVVGGLTGWLGVFFLSRIPEPRIEGDVRLQNVALALPDAGISLQELNLTARATSATTLKLTGRARSGTGTAQLDGEWHLEPDRGWPLQLSLRGNEFEILRTSEAWVTISPNLNLRMAGQRIDIEGDITVPAAKLEPVGLPEGITVSRDTIITGAEAEEDTSQYMRRDIYSRVRITLGKEVYFNGFKLRGRLSGEVVAVDTPQTLTTATGELVIHNGRYLVHGEKLEVDPGRFVFAGGPIDDPGVDARALRRFDEVVAGVQVRGTLKAPRLTLFSEPVMRESDILAYIVLGRPLDQSTRSEAALLIGVSSLLNISGSRGLNDQIAGRFGLEEISLRPGATPEEGVSLMLGKYLSPRLYVTYMIGLMDSVNTVRARYKVGKRITLQGESSTIQSGADILYTIER